MDSSSTRWRVSPAGFVVGGLAITAEAISNALRAYGLGTHLERFTLTTHGVTVSVSGLVLVLAAVAVSLAQARAAWVAMTPMAPARQRVVSGFAAVLLLIVSGTAMSSHILEAQRAKTGDESGQRARWDRAEAAYAKAKSEFDALGTPRPVSVIQADIQATKIDMVVWRRSNQCADISRDDTKNACRPILALYKERGAAARKLELEPEVARLKQDLDQMSRPEAQSSAEETVSGWWAWIMAAAVVFLATFGSVIFARVEQLETTETVATTSRETTWQPLPSLPPGNGRSHTKEQALADLLTRLGSGRPFASQDEMASEWNRTKGCVSRWLAEWEDLGLVTRANMGKCKVAATA